MMNTQEFLALNTTYGANNYSPLPVVLTRGEGIWVYDVEGRRYLDGLSAYSAVNHGHCHPRLVQTLISQAQRLTLASRAFHTDQYLYLMQKLAQFTGFGAALPMNSGVEAVETSIKLARKWGYTIKGIPLDQAEIIVVDNNFHGRTITVISFSSEELYKHYFGPFTPGFTSVPYGDIAAMQAAITPNTAAIFIEPIQGEAGVVIPPVGYLEAVRQLCNQENVLLLLDEIQTGLGRTGKLFAYQHENLRPDMVIIGKALSGGMYPVSAVLADRDLMDLFVPGEHGSTFGGNPLGAAIAVEALSILEDEGLIANAALLGERALQQLQAIESPFIHEVRGRGLLIGIELVPEAGGARRFCEKLKDLGLLCKETHDNVIRFAPPLIIDEASLDWAIAQIRQVLKEVPTQVPTELVPVQASI